MGYRIDYQPDGKDRHISKRHAFFPFVLVTVCAVLVILACVYPGTARELVLELLFPGDAACTVASLDNMVEEMKAGTSFPDAFRLFCRQVIAG